MPSPARGPAERTDDPAGADQGPGDPASPVISDELITERGKSAGDDWITVPADKVHLALAGLKADGYRLPGFLTCVAHPVHHSRPTRPRRYHPLYQPRDPAPPPDLPLRALV